MSIDIQWDRLAQPNVTGNLLSGYQAGKGMKKERETANALGMFANGDAEGAYKALLAVDPEKAMAIRKVGREDKVYAAREAAGPMIAAGEYGKAARSVAGIDPEFATQLMTWQKTASAEAKAAAAEKAETVARALLPLKGLSPEQQAARWPSIKAQLGGNVPDIDFSQPGIVDQHINQALEVKDLIDQGNKDREFAATTADRQADNARDERRLGLEGARVGIARSNSARGWAAHEERKRNKGYGTPGAGGSSEWEEF